MFPTNRKKNPKPFRKNLKWLEKFISNQPTLKRFLNLWEKKSQLVSEVCFQPTNLKKFLNSLEKKSQLVSKVYFQLTNRKNIPKPERKNLNWLAKHVSNQP